MSNRFEGKGALISGAASGIGLASTRRLVAEGAHVVLVDVNPEGERLVAELGAHTTFLVCDVSDADAVAATVHAASGWLQAAGVRMDVLFNNAGIGSIGETPDLEVADWRRVLAVDLDSIFYACRVAIPIMRSAGGGAIINTASISGLGGDYGFAAYNAAKGAVVNYTRTLALDHGKDNIRVNALCPGFIRTGLTPLIEAQPELMAQWHSLIPLGRPGTADEMAGVVAFLASDDAAYVTGAMLVADGGITARTGQPNLMAALGAVPTTDR